MAWFKDGGGKDGRRLRIEASLAALSARDGQWDGIER